MLNERKLTETELESREVVLQGLLQNKRNLVKKYGKEAEKVMYGIATKKAKSKVEGMNKEKIKELIQQTLTKEDATPKNEDYWADYQDIGQFYLEGFGREHTLTNSQLEELGKKIVKQLYKGDVGKAYDEIVKRVREDNDPSGANLEGDPSEYVVGENEDKFSNAVMNDLIQSVRNLAHTGGMSEQEAAEIAIDSISQKFEVEGINERVSFDDILDLRAKKKDLEDRIAQVYRDMEQEAEPEGGEVSDRYGSELDKLEGKLYKVMSKINDYDMNESKETLKEFTDTSFKGSDVIDDANERGPDMFGKGIFADLLPKGVASENDAIEALKAHDKSGIKSRMGRYAPMFVHLQYHDLEHEGEKYRIHQTQYYNSNFKDKDPSFNPGTSKITLFKVTKPAVDRFDREETDNLGTIVVKTDQYTQDLKNLPGLGKRVSEEVTKPEEEKLKKIKKELEGASKMHAGQAKKIAKIVKEKLTKRSSVEDHVDDFKDSDAKQFKGKSLKKIKQMALASFLSKQKK